MTLTWSFNLITMVVAMQTMWRRTGKSTSFNLAENFAKNKSGGAKVTYTNPIAVSKNGGWRYNYGNMFYVELVNQYLNIKQFSNETVQAVMNEASKYQGWKYVYGGSNPNTSFDCSGFVSLCVYQFGCLQYGKTYCTGNL